MFANQVIPLTQICDVTPVWRGSTGLNGVIRKSRPRHVTDHKINSLLFFFFFFWRTELLHKQNCCSEIAARQSPREREGWGCMGGEGKEDWRWWKCEPHIRLRRFTISPNLRKAVKDAFWHLITMIKKEKNNQFYTTFKHYVFVTGSFPKNEHNNGAHVM